MYLNSADVSVCQPASVASANKGITHTPTYTQTRAQTHTPHYTQHLTMKCLPPLMRLFVVVYKGVPETFSRFVAAFGVAAGLDPYLLLIVDFMAGNHDCASKCPDYTSPTCRCHEGDAWKLYVRLDAEEGAGISGALLTVLVRFSLIWS